MLLETVHKAHNYCKTAVEYSDRGCAFSYAANEFLRYEGLVRTASLFLLGAGVVLVIITTVEFVHHVTVEKRISK